jgi:hypothetical protein
LSAARLLKILTLTTMQVFSCPIHIEPGQHLGGYVGERICDTSSDELELNGLLFNDPSNGVAVEVCSLDALYAGELVEVASAPNVHRIFAASHTHYAMLDARKPRLGKLSAKALTARTVALREVARRTITPEYCRIWRAPVSVPIYRRFDIPDSFF